MREGTGAKVVRLDILKDRVSLSLYLHSSLVPHLPLPPTCCVMASRPTTYMRVMKDKSLYTYCEPTGYCHVIDDTSAKEVEKRRRK